MAGQGSGGFSTGTASPLAVPGEMLDVEESYEERALGTVWSGAVAVLVLLALLVHQGALVLLAVTLALVVLVTWLWRRYGLERLSYRRTLEPPAAFHGEEVTLVMRMANRKILPLPWIAVDEELPPALVALGARASPSHVMRRMVLSSGVDLGAFQAVTRRYRLRCVARGYHQVGPTTLRVGDPFGLVVRRLTLRPRDHVVVYPRVVDLGPLGLSSVYPLGERRSAHLLHEDPARLGGIREYRAGDSLRRIHWKASAHTGMLQVKTFDPSAMVDVMLALDVTTVAAGSWQHDTDALELGICAAASLAYAYLQDRRSVGLLTNGIPAGQAEHVCLLPGRSPGQLVAVLDALARLGPWAHSSLAALLAGQIGSLPPGATLTVITAVLSADLAEVLLAYRGAGYAVNLLLLSDAPDGREGPALPGIPIYYLGGAERWQALQASPVPAELYDASRAGAQEAG